MKWSCHTYGLGVFLARSGEWRGLRRLPDGNVYALNAHTGAKLWTYSTGDTVDSSPAVADGVVFLARDAAHVCAESPHRQAAWSRSMAVDVFSEPTLADGIVYIGAADGKLYALDARTGNQLWSYHYRRRCEFVARRGEWSLIHSVAVLQSTPALSFRTTICKVFFIHD